jgi:signal transduction histidine kinase
MKCLNYSCLKIKKNDSFKSAINQSVANILKHAKAHKVAILIYEELNGLVLKISDNGRGFDAQLQDKGRGIGMLSIKARVAELKGNIKIVSGKNGTEITVVIPT